MKRSGWRWIWIAITISVLGAWLVYVPRRLDRLFDAVPVNAIFVSQHDQVAQRWSRIQSFPPLRPWLASQKLLVRKGTNEWSTPPEVALWLKRLASDRVVLAYSPRVGSQDQPAWIGVAWTGWRTRYLHWMMRLGMPEGIRQDLQDSVHLFWVADLGGTPNKQYLSFSFQEGMTVACLSSDPDAVRSVLIQMDHRRPGNQAALFSMPGPIAPAAGPVADRAWILKPGSPMSAPDRYCPIRIDRLDAGGLTGTLFLPPMLPLETGWSTGSELESGGWAPSTPALWFKMPDTVWPVLARTFSLAGPVRMVGEGLLPASADSPHPVYGGVLNADYEVRIKGPFRNIPFLSRSGLKLPTILVAVPMPDGEGVSMGQIMGLLDRLNARQGWGLIPHPIALPGRTLTVIEESRPNLYGQFELDERVALAPMDRTLLVSSHAGSLRRLLNRAPVPGETCSWQILKGDDVFGGIWLEGASAWPIIRNILGATMLIQSASGSSPDRDSHNEMGDWTRWWDACRSLNQATVVVRVDSAGGPARADFSVLFD